MNIHCYFSIGKPKHQEEVGLVVTMVCCLVLLKKELDKAATLFFFCSTSAKRLRDTTNIALRAS